jgi:hypothetical protein
VALPSAQLQLLQQLLLHWPAPVHALPKPLWRSLQQQLLLLWQAAGRLQAQAALRLQCWLQAAQAAQAAPLC